MSQPTEIETLELPACTRYADRMHRFKRYGEDAGINDELGNQYEGTGFRCLCDAALIYAPDYGPGFQLVVPAPDGGYWIGP